MKYFATFGTTRSEALFASNPYGHTSLLYFRVDESTANPPEILEHWGFYGMPNTHREKGIFDAIKQLTHFDFDFMGNHGYFRHEEPRFSEFNSQYYLNGSTFELTEEQFEELDRRCKKVADEQTQAIEEAIRELNTIPSLDLTPLSKYQYHPFEHISPLLFELEKNKSKKAGRESRLIPFDFTLSVEWHPLNFFGLNQLGMGWWGPHLRDSRSCKVLMLNLLNDILTPAQINHLTENGKHPSVPRFSGASEDLYLYSTGSLQSIQKKDGSKAYYHPSFGYKENNDVRTYFAIPPQQVETLLARKNASYGYSDAEEREIKLVNTIMKFIGFLPEELVDYEEQIDEVKNLLAIEPHHYPRVKKAVEQLLKLRWLLINAGLSEKTDPSLIQLMDLVRAFATVDPNKEQSKKAQPSAFGMNLNSLFKTQDHSVTGSLLKQTAAFFDKVYQTIAETLQDEFSDISRLNIEQKKRICELFHQKYPDSLYSEGELESACVL